MTNYIWIDGLIKGLTEPELLEMHQAISLRLESFYRARALPINDEEKTLIEEGRYIQAIKAYRQRNQVGLREAKTAIDTYRDGL